MRGNEEYLKSLCSNDLQRLIVENLDLPAEELIAKCIEFLSGDENAED